MSKRELKAYMVSAHPNFVLVATQSRVEPLGRG